MCFCHLRCSFCLDILQRTGIDTSDETVKSMESKYSIKKDFPVNYWTFLKKFLITLNPDQILKNAVLKEWSPRQAVSFKLPLFSSVFEFSS